MAMKTGAGSPVRVPQQQQQQQRQQFDRKAKLEYVNQRLAEDIPEQEKRTVACLRRLMMPDTCEDETQDMLAVAAAAATIDTEAEPLPVKTGVNFVGATLNSVQICVPDPGVSGLHALIEVCENGIEHFVEDLDSTNGTTIGIGGYRLYPNKLYQLSHNKVIGFGPYRFRYEMTEPLTSVEIACEEVADARTEEGMDERLTTTGNDVAAVHVHGMFGAVQIHGDSSKHNDTEAHVASTANSSASTTGGDESDHDEMHMGMAVSPALAPEMHMNSLHGGDPSMVVTAAFEMATKTSGDSISDLPVAFSKINPMLSSELVASAVALSPQLIDGPLERDVDGDRGLASILAQADAWDATTGASASIPTASSKVAEAVASAHDDDGSAAEVDSGSANRPSRSRKQGRGIRRGQVRREPTESPVNLTDRDAGDFTSDATDTKPPPPAARSRRTKRSLPQNKENSLPDADAGDDDELSQINEVDLFAPSVKLDVDTGTKPLAEPKDERPRKVARNSRKVIPAKSAPSSPEAQHQPKTSSEVVVAAKPKPGKQKKVEHKDDDNFDDDHDHDDGENAVRQKHEKTKPAASLRRGKPVTRPETSVTLPDSRQRPGRANKTSAVIEIKPSTASTLDPDDHSQDASGNMDLQDHLGAFVSLPPSPARKQRKRGSDVLDESKEQQPKKTKRADNGGITKPKLTDTDKVTAPAAEHTTKPAVVAPVSNPKQPLSQLSATDKSTSKDATRTKSDTKTTSAVRVLFTGIPEDDDRREIVEMLGGTIVESWSDCTHLVTDRVRRTVKFLCAMSAGKHVMSVRWLEVSKKQGKFVDEAKHGLRDSKCEKQYGFSLTKTISNIRNSNNKTHLFAERRHVFCTPNVRPDADQLDEILSAAGGSLIKDKSQLDRDTIVIGHENDAAMCADLKRKGHVVYNIELVLTGILRNALALESSEFLLAPKQGK